MDKREKQEIKEQERRMMEFKYLVAKTNLEFAAKLFFEKGRVGDIVDLDFYQWLNICKTIPVVSMFYGIVLEKMSALATKKFSQWHDIYLCAPQGSVHEEISLQRMEELARTVEHWLIVYKCAVSGSEQSARAILNIRRLGNFETWLKILNNSLFEGLKEIAIEELNVHHKISDQWLGICKNVDPDSVLGKLALERAKTSLRDDNIERCFSIYKNVALPLELRQAAFERISGQI